MPVRETPPLPAALDTAAATVPLYPAGLYPAGPVADAASGFSAAPPPSPRYIHLALLSLAPTFATAVRFALLDGVALLEGVVLVGADVRADAGDAQAKSR